ncbi:MAG TPA: hypothetical protein VMY18_00230, partial [Acidobacteriota bacterium]|nr:hypothetical protein [Acidobacteriota bacterium]
MLDTNAVAVALVAGNGVVDKLELETGLPKSDTTFLGVYQAKLAAGPTRKDEDMHFIKILTRW